MDRDEKYAGDLEFTKRQIMDGIWYISGSLEIEETATAKDIHL